MAEEPESADPGAANDSAGASADDASADAPSPPPESASDGGDLLQPDEIEALLGQSKAAPAAPPPPPSVENPANVAQGDVELLLSRAEEALRSVTEETSTTLPDGVRPYQLTGFTGAPASEEAATLDLIRDVELNVRIELGRTHMHLEDVLKLRKGSVVPLDKLAGDPVDVYVNGRLVARGEVLVLNDAFCVRIADLIAGESAVA